MVRCVLVTLLAFASATCGGSEGRPTASPASPASVAVAPTPTATTPVPSGARVEDLAAQHAFDAGHTLDAAANADAVSWTAERWLLP